MPSEQALQQKKQTVKELVEVLNSAKSFILADYRGLTVEEDTELRRKLREEGVNYSVVKNTLTRFAMKEQGIEGLEEFLIGPTAIATHDEDPVAPARVLAKFAKEHENLQVKAGVVEGDVVGLERIKAIAELPSKEELVAKVMAGFNAPIAGFVNVLNGNIRGLLIALNQIAEQKQ